ncbi:EamA family transporter [Clostridium bovifaecis]|uniref:EamA family transporter n=1 Tax=Clostridium bovifaecis TaxID=2184719 RepID=A0A6I6F2Z2_9CLOT|nr:EamA family transporter [Clostridium bovifaecis]
MEENNTKNEHLKAVGLLVITAILWSFGGILIKLVKWNPIAIAGMRSGIASILLLTIIKKPKWDWNATKIGGTIAYVSMLVLFVSANKYTTAANAILLQYTAPVYIAIFGKLLLNEKTENVDWFFIAIIVGGMVLFFRDDIGGGSLKGNILGVLSGVAFAFNVIFIRKQKDGNPIEGIFWGNIFTFIISIPFMFKSMPDARGWTGLILLGVVQIGLSYVLYTKAIKNVTALEGVLIPVVEPILNPVWVFLFIGERPGKWSLIGGTIVLAAVTLRAVYMTLKTMKYKNISA